MGGQDVFYKGALPDETLQNEVIQFARNSSLYSSDIARVIEPGNTILSIRTDRDFEKFRSWDFSQLGCFGIVYNGTSEDWFSWGQLMFDRNNGGRICTIALPYLGDLDDRDATPTISEGGHIRIPGTLYFCFFLYIIKLRWMPFLKVLAEDEGMERVIDKVKVLGINGIIRDKQLGFDECWGFYEREHGKRFPPAPPRKEASILSVYDPVRVVDLDCLNTRIQDLDFSVRTENCCRAVGAQTVRDLIKHSQSEMLSWRNFGKKSLVEIVETLDKFGIVLREE